MIVMIPIMKWLVLILFIYIFFTDVSHVFAQSPQVTVKVNHVATVLEKFQEKVTLFFKFSKNDKYNFQKYLLEKRLAELKYVIDNNDWDPVEETSSRYATYLGNFTDFVLKNRLSDKKRDVLETYERHEQILEDLHKKINIDSGWWLLLQHDINLTKIYGEQIKNATSI